MTRAVTIEAYVQATAARDPYAWARVHRIMPDGLTYSVLGERYHVPYLCGLYTAIGELAPNGRIVVQKAAQMGWTEAALNTAFWFLDTKREGVLYMMPTDRQLSDFSQARVNRAVQASPYISAHCQDVSNVQLKILFGQALYLRGAVSHEKLVEIPVGLVIRDEYDMMDPEGAELALSRLGASQYKWVFDLGNPRFPDTGIDAAWRGGTREVWQLACPRCGLWSEPQWPDSVDMATERLVCPDCHTPADKTKGRWHAQNRHAPYRSFRISQLVSPTVTPGELILAWKEAQGDQTRLQLFYNMRLGLPYAPQGARITDEILSSLPRGGEMAAGSSRPCVMGIDVGSVLHVIVRRIEGGIIWAGTTNWNELDRMMSVYNVRDCGIDAMPETTMAMAFAKRWPGRVRLVRYLPPMSLGKREVEERGVTIIEVSRTEALDRAFARLLRGDEQIPTNLPREVRVHWQALTRQIVKTPKSEYAVWVESGPDHYAHALAYSELVRDERPPWERVGLH